MNTYTNKEVPPALEMITLELAGEQDIEAIAALRGSEGFSMLSDFQLEQFTMKATRPNGQVVATLCFGIVDNKDDLDKRLGMSVLWDDFSSPIGIVSDTYALPITSYDGPLKLVALVVADLLSFGAVVTKAAAPEKTCIVSPKENFDLLIQKLLSFTVSYDWTWKGDLPFHNLLPDLQALGPIEEFARRTYSK